MPQHRHDRGLVAIAAFKMVKSVLLILAGIGALSLLNAPVAENVREWLSDLSIRGGHRIIERALAILDVASPQKMTLVGAASILYGIVFAVEGVGLWLAKRWAEYLTVIVTGSLIPFEIYELTQRMTVVRALALVVNVAVVIYLIYRLRNPTPRGATEKLRSAAA